MQYRPFGSLGQVSALALGGGGIAGNWGPTAREEAVATALEAVDAGITLIDTAPTYGGGEGERVIGEAFDGHVPEGVRISTKLGIDNNPRPDRILPMLQRSIDESVSQMRIEHIDIFILHSQIIPDDGVGVYRGTTRSLFVEGVRPAFEKLVAQGRISAWGVTGIGVPSAILETIREEPAPSVVQCIANVLDSAGELRRFEEPERPRDLIEAASSRGVGIMGIRPVQAGALTDSVDRELSDDHPVMVDFRRAKPFRALARGTGESAASLAHRYALSMQGVSTVVLGVKNRDELRECLAAEASGPIGPELIARIDGATVVR